MADFNLPATLATAYADALDYLKARDVDAFSLADTGVTNPIAGMIRYLRASNKFQEYDGASWNDKVLSVAGGGTGSATAAGARTALGLGSIATQDANNVTITGGTIPATLLTGTVPLARLAGLTTAQFASAAISQWTNDSAYINGSALNASNLNTGTIPDGRFPATLPALNGSLLTALNGSAIASGTVAPARLGSNVSATRFLRGDGVWSEVAMVIGIQEVNSTFAVPPTTHDISLTSTLTDYTKAVFIPSLYGNEGTLASGYLRLISNTALRWTTTFSTGGPNITVVGKVVEFFVP